MMNKHQGLWGGNSTNNANNNNNANQNSNNTVPSMVWTPIDPNNPSHQYFLNK
jgi:hypothetical protein